MTKAQRDIKREMRMLEYARECGNIVRACRGPAPFAVPLEASGAPVSLPS